MQMEMHGTSERTIQIQLMASLDKEGSPQRMLVITPEETVFDVIRRLGINVDLVQMAFADGKFISFESTLDKTKKLLLLPAIGGG